MSDHLASAMNLLRLPFEAMACRCEVVIDGVAALGGAAQVQVLAQRAVDEVRRIEHTYSRYRPDSIVSRINAAAGGKPVECDDETVALLTYAHTLYEASDGLFDITSGVLRRAWDFKAHRVPSAAELDALRPLIGWPQVQREGKQVRLARAGMEIDFGGFGKEYAADRAGALLATLGVQHGYVNLGGDMRVLGPKADGRPWMIGIQHPRKPRELMASIPLQRGGLATSGDYERFFAADGKRYCHILDPRSGQPVSYWRTVSVLAPLAVVAGNGSTIAMLMQERGLDFLRASGLDFLAVDHQGLIYRRDAEPTPGDAGDAAATPEQTPTSSLEG